MKVVQQYRVSEFQCWLAKRSLRAASARAVIALKYPIKHVSKPIDAFSHLLAYEISRARKGLSGFIVLCFYANLLYFPMLNVLYILSSLCLWPFLFWIIISSDEIHGWYKEIIYHLCFFCMFLKYISRLHHVHQRHIYVLEYICYLINKIMRNRDL